MRAGLFSTFRLVLCTVCMVLPLQFAQAQGGLASERHFPGQRYLSLMHLQVFEQADRSSKVLADIARWHMVYAVKTSDPDWLEIKGASLGEHLLSSFMTARHQEIDLVDGKFNVQHESIDKNSYRERKGYVQARFLGTLEEIHPFPPPKAGLTRIKGVWEPLGIPESRFAPNDPGAAPFSAVVRVQLWAKSPEFTGPLDIGISCSGFFMENTMLVGTAGHCFRASDIDGIVAEIRRVLHGRMKNPESITIHPYITITDRRGKKEEIEATLLDSVDSKYRDWALLKLKRKPKTPVSVLHLLSPGSWLKSGTVRALTLGFGGDLEEVATQQLKKPIVRGDWCDIALPLVRVATQEDATVIHTDTGRTPCVTWHGDSGGPLVIWNDTTRRHEVLGIVSAGENVGAVFEHAMTAKAYAAFTSHSDKLLRQYQITSKEWQSIPGVAAVDKLVYYTIRLYKPENFYLLSEDFVAAVHAQTRRKWDAQAYFSPFLAHDIGLKNTSERYDDNERSDVLPTQALRTQEFGAPTPLSVPGGTVIVPSLAWQMILDGRDGLGPAPLVLSAIDDQEFLPTAIDASFAAEPGDFDDDVQKQLLALLASHQASPDTPIITYCHHKECWLSYNVALRLLKAGHPKVFWLREGVSGWRRYGLPFASAQFPARGK